MWLVNILDRKKQLRYQWRGSDAEPSCCSAAAVVGAAAAAAAAAAGSCE